MPVNNLWKSVFHNNLFIKTKVSGCFRSEEGAQEYLTIMSYIGTARKHGINAFTAIREALNETPDIIFN